MNRVKLDLFINYYLPITFEIKLFIPFTTSVVINIHSSPLIGNAVTYLHSTPSSLIPLHPLFISTIVTSWPTELVNIQSSLCHLLCTTHQFTPPVLLIGHWTGTTTAVDLQLTHPVPCLPLSLSPDQLTDLFYVVSIIQRLLANTPPHEPSGPVDETNLPFIRPLSHNTHNKGKQKERVRIHPRTLNANIYFYN